MVEREQVRARIVAAMATARVPGLAVGVMRGETLEYAEGFGVTSVEDGGCAITSETLFRIGSLTKPLTATAVLRLVEAGRLELDRPITQYLPGYTLGEPDIAERITLRQLLSHTAGLAGDAEHFGSRDAEGLRRYIWDEMPRFAASLPPGSAWGYSNPGYCLAGHIVEVVTGLTFAAAIEEWVCAPLAMGRTTFDPLVAMTYPLAQAHDLHVDGTLRVRHRFAENTAHYPAGFALSTLRDLAHFAQLHLARGIAHNRRLLLAETVRMMHTRQARLSASSSEGYGMGWFVDTYNGDARVSHPGAISTFGAQLMLLPERQVGVVLLCNRAEALPLATLANWLLDEAQGR